MPGISEVFQTIKTLEKATFKVNCLNSSYSNYPQVDRVFEDLDTAKIVEGYLKQASSLIENINIRSNFVFERSGFQISLIVKKKFEEKMASDFFLTIKKAVKTFSEILRLDWREIPNKKISDGPFFIGKNYFIQQMKEITGSVVFSKPTSSSLSELIYLIDCKNKRLCQEKVTVIDYTREIFLIGKKDDVIALIQEVFDASFFQVDPLFQLCLKKLKEEDVSIDKLPPTLCDEVMKYRGPKGMRKIIIWSDAFDFVSHIVAYKTDQHNLIEKSFSFEDKTLFFAIVDNKTLLWNSKNKGYRLIRLVIDGTTRSNSLFLVNSAILNTIYMRKATLEEINLINQSIGESKATFSPKNNFGKKIS